MPLPEFGPFASVFERGELSVPGYLKLLSLDQPSAQIVIDRISRALSVGDPRPWVEALFRDVNWRPHLVAAIALLLDDGAVLPSIGLWRAIDTGSWVSPQLVVTAYFTDARFPDELRARLNSGCTITVPAGLSPAERHSATGPESPAQRSAKLATALVYIGSLLSSQQSLVNAAAESPAVRDLLSDDADDGAGIAARWMDNLRKHFAMRGRDLRPKAA